MHIAEIQSILLSSVREYFKRNNFLDVLPPPVVENPGMETHIHPFKIKSAFKGTEHDLYLHTSPEFHMKKLLSEGLEKIFTINYCFRDEPNSLTHRKQFLMLEWYRANSRYERIMSDTEELVTFVNESLSKHKIHSHYKNSEIKFEKQTIQNLFLEYVGFDVLDFLDTESLKEKINKDFKDINLPDFELPWEDYYFLIFLNHIEPKLVNRDFLLLYEYPAPLAALSTLKGDDPRVCERFELYISGLEIANCFNELTDLNIQKTRFNAQHEQKEKLYNYSLPEAKMLYNALIGGMPESSGIAMGLERLLMGLTKRENPFYE